MQVEAEMERVQSQCRAEMQHLQVQIEQTRSSDRAEVKQQLQDQAQLQQVEAHLQLVHSKYTEDMQKLRAEVEEIRLNRAEVEQLVAHKEHSRMQDKAELKQLR